MIIDHVLKSNCGGDRNRVLLQGESFWIHTLWLLSPMSLNTNLSLTCFLREQWFITYILFTPDYFCSWSIVFVLYYYYYCLFVSLYLPFNFYHFLGVLVAFFVVLIYSYLHLWIGSVFFICSYCVLAFVICFCFSASFCFSVLK